MPQRVRFFDEKRRRGEDFRQLLQSAGKDVFFVAISPLATLADHRDLFVELATRDTNPIRFKWLVLDPGSSPQVMMAVQAYLEESQWAYQTELSLHRLAIIQRDIEARAAALDQWAVRVYKDIIPGPQVIFIDDRLASIEIVPFSTRTNHRPGLHIPAGRRSFDSLWESYWKLWNSYSHEPDLVSHKERQCICRVEPQWQ